jgi:hypothetical protein
MERIPVNFLVCLVLCVGCSSVKPPQNSSAVVTTAGQSQNGMMNTNFMARFLNGWLKKSPPPEPYYTDNNFSDVAAFFGKVLEGPPPDPPLITVPSSAQSPNPTIPFRDP